MIWRIAVFDAILCSCCCFPAATAAADAADADAVHEDAMHPCACGMERLARYSCAAGSRKRM